MVIVLVQWRITPTDEAVAQFKKWWRETRLEDDSGLFGEFLSRPIPSHELPYDSDDLSAVDGSYVTFMNVGIWREEGDFYSQVGKYFDDNAPSQPFEARRRIRTILRCEARSMGSWLLPADDPQAP